MLNELYELSKALEHHGLLQSATHPNISNVGKVDCLLIEIDKEGIPQATRLLQKDETAKLWKHSKGNHNSFPAIRVQKPLLATAESTKVNGTAWKKAKLSEKISTLNKLDYEAINPESTDIKISGWTVDELAPVLVSAQPELAALKQLISVFPHKGQGAAFTAMVANLLRRKVVYCDNEAELDFIKELLVGSWDEKTKKYAAGCMTYYDVHETAGYPNLNIAPATQQALIRLLNSTGEGSRNVSEDGIESPFSGRYVEGVGEKYPNPNIPLLGLTYLYSKKSDTPCLTRYKMSGAEAFQAGRTEAMAINDAIAFLTQETRKNKSWKAVSDSNREKPNLLLAYLTDNPQNNAYLAQILGDPSDYASEDEYKEETESAFDALCQQVLGNIDEVIQKNPLTKINLIMLEALDPGRKQVVYEKSLTAERFRHNLLQWSEAAKNHPEIAIRVREKNKIISYKHACPGPNEICQLLKINYTRSGLAKPMKQSAVSLHDIYQLYMPPDDLTTYNASYLNDILLKATGKTAQMIGDVGQQMILAYALPATKETYTRAKFTASSIALLAILLWRLGARKEKYMIDAPFNVGQFLQLSDMLHKEYCIQVRNSGKKNAPLPPQLMGNELLAIASENPTEGLNRLRERMKIYLAWANTASGENAGLAKWILGRFSEVSAKIAANTLPEQFTPAEQAQVLLGYLAAIPYEKKNKEDEPRE